MIVRYELWFLKLCLFWLAGFIVVYTALSGGSEIGYGVALGIAAATAWYFDGKDAYFKPTYNAHWAMPKEVGDLFTKLTRLRGDEFLLGFTHGKPIALRRGVAGRKEMGHIAILGPTRAGKGLNIFANLLNWRGSVVVVDIKGEMFDRTSGYRADMLKQDVFRLNPTSGEETNTYDPFTEREKAEQLLSSCQAILNPAGDGSNQVFALRATFALFALLRSAKLLGEPPLTFVKRCLGMGLEGAMKHVDEVAGHDEDVRLYSTLFTSMPVSQYDWKKVGDDRFLQNSWLNMTAKLLYLLSRGIIGMTSGSDFKATDLLRKPASVYLTFKETDLGYTVHAMSAVLLSITDAIMRHRDAHPDEPFTPVLFVLDEAGIVHVPDLPRLVSTGAGRGIVFAIYVQDAAQLEAMYGPEGAKIILSNTHTKVFFTPKEEQTAEYLSKIAGKYMVENRTDTRGQQNLTSDGYGFVARELITVDDALEMPLGRVVIRSNEYPLVAAYRMEPFVLSHAREAMNMPPKTTKPTTRTPEEAAPGPRAALRPPAKVLEGERPVTPVLQGSAASELSEEEQKNWLASVMNATKDVAK